MGALIVLFVRLMVALTTAAVLLFIWLARLTALLVGIVAKETAQLIQQTNAKTRSPDGRYWWNGQKWVPMLGLEHWAVPIGALAVVVVVTGVCATSSLSPSSTLNGQTASVASPDVGSGPQAEALQTASSSPSPSPSPSPKPSQSPAPVAAPAPPPPLPPQNLCGAPPNPWGYNFCGGNVIYSPPGNFCSYFNCIPSFWMSTNGYVDECQDGTYSHSGGRQGACSYHGGELRPLYSH